MLKARVDTPRFLSLYYPTASLTTPRVRILDSSATLIDTLTLAASTTLADLYISSAAVTATALGVYTLVFEESDGSNGWDVVDTQEMNVGVDPVTDIILSTTTNQSFRIDDSIIGDNTSTVTLDILKEGDTLHEATIAATFVAADSSYKAATTTPISAEGLYHLLWYDDGAIDTVVTILAFEQKGLPTVEVVVVDTSSGATVPYSGVQVLFSYATGVPYASAVTNSFGTVSLPIPYGTWTVTLFKSGTTFSSNNLSFVVINTDKVEGNNNLSYDVKSFDAVFTTYTSSQSLCTISATLLDMGGSPLRCIDVLVELFQGPSNFSGTGVFGTSKVYRTDANGYVEFDLIQGITVTASIVSHGWRRRFTVPATATANLLSLAASSDDLFDIIEVSLPAALVRSI